MGVVRLFMAVAGCLVVGTTATGFVWIIYVSIRHLIGVHWCPLCRQPDYRHSWQRRPGEPCPCCGDDLEEATRIRAESEQTDRDLDDVFGR